ncbi:MAG: hypothetical protein KF784_14410 [Fimbriimonadaceae bacterium]|nr:hypothetical protein [Fimbriimonadaceae bacterium]
MIDRVHTASIFVQRGLGQSGWTVGGDRRAAGGDQRSAISDQRSAISDQRSAISDQRVNDPTL